MTINIRTQLLIAWDGVSFSDESAYLLSAHGDMRYAAPFSSLIGGAGITDQMMLEMDNRTGRFSPLNSASPIYSSISNGGMYMRPVRLSVSVDGGTSYYRVFTGVLKLPSAQSPTWQESSTITLDARSMDELLLNHRMSSSLNSFAAGVDSPRTEAEIIEDYITSAGFSTDVLALDPGLMRIPYAWMDDESVLEECWLLAAATGGRFYADQDGKFRYENLAAWQRDSRATTTQQIYSTGGEAAFQRLEFRYDDSDIYNEVVVEASPRSVGGQDVIWESDGIVACPPNSSVEVAAKFSAPAYSIWGVEMAARDIGGNDLTSSISLTATYYAQRATLGITNSATLAAYLSRLQILGRVVTGAPDQEATRTSASHGVNNAFFAGRIQRSRRIGGNPYVQSLPQAEMLAQRALDVSEYPRLAFVLIGCNGDPTRRLGDRIAVDHSAIAGFMSSQAECYVVGLRWTLDQNGFTQDIEAVQAANLFRYDGGYFVLGAHTWGDNRRIFY